MQLCIISFKFQFDILQSSSTYKKDNKNKAYVIFQNVLLVFAVLKKAKVQYVRIHPHHLITPVIQEDQRNNNYF